MQREAKADYALLSVLAGALLVGYCVYVLLVTTGCGTLAGAGKDLKEAAPWLPSPWGNVADIGGTVLLMLTGRKAAKRLRRSRRARRAVDSARTR
jgi:predicted small secreted protein